MAIYFCGCTPGSARSEIKNATRRGAIKSGENIFHPASEGREGEGRKSDVVLMEVLRAEAIRSHIEATPDTGWLGAIKDPVVGRAMAGIHATPGEDWQSVSISPSRFAARF